MKLGYLIRGLPGHPLHPPLTDATIGIYTFATIAALADVLGISNNAATHGWWLALLAGLITTVATALTGLLDWLTIERGTELWKTATLHMATMVSATVFFGLNTLFLLLGLARTAPLGSRLVSILLWLIGLGAIIFLWNKESTSYFQATSAPRY